MAEEKFDQPSSTLDSDTMNAFRFVLQSVKGISPVSQIAELAGADDLNAA